MQNEDLISQAQSGDTYAQGEVVREWYPRIYNYAFKYFGESDLAAEAAQQTFITMHHKIDQLKECSKFKSWIYTIATNICRQESRKGKRHRWLSFDQLLPKKEEDTSPVWEVSKPREHNPEQTYLRSELGGILNKCLQQLSKDQREVLIMKEYEGLKFREIAEALNVSENTVKSRLYYAFSHMRKLLAKENITENTLKYEN
ncbi:RNA polymerase sigma factor [Marivirga arenosa]|uniref:RNA polymerase sigma factor n=1 Tax=Marivirga arenosa TaxID=3059076 RepID=A0AA49GDI4_9BACT|nr:RNA polymerase sigma factor [Marivirga sp. ABR2-2]WKK83536.2 RNA polymerase sigma factor [Marivirga sp. ABR2-2]